mgnify:FL=1
MKKQEIIIPQAIHSTYEGYLELFKTFQCYVKDVPDDLTDIVMDFRGNTWFDANLLPIVYAFAEYGQNKHNINSRYENQTNCKLHKLLIRNNFAKLCFQLEHKPRKNETVVPFKVFKSNDTYGFGNYIDAEIVRYFPVMEENVKRDLSGYIQELFGNAQIHGNCIKVYTCGQYYPANHKMDFTIVNLGTTIKTNVVEYLRDINSKIPENCIEWAVQPEHSTKRINSGGIGLSLMKEFIHYNNGKYQIVSGNEFWELDKKMENSKELKYHFPGTIVNIEIDQNDTNIYKYEQIKNEKDMDDEIF